MRRLWIALAVAAAPILVTVPLVLSWRDRLPVELASHWSLGPEPDGFTGRDSFLDGWAVAAVAAVALGVLVILLLRRGRRVAVLVMGAVTGFVAALGLVMAVPNLDLADPREARVGWVAAIPLALMALVAGLAWWAHGRPDEPVQVAQAPPSSDLPRLATDEEARYDEAKVLWWIAVVVFALLAGLGVIVWVTLTPWLGGELIVFALVVAFLNRNRIRASEAEDLALSAGFITHRIPIAELTGARVIDEVNPFSEFGGWGLRYRPRTVAMAQRKGPGVEVGRTDERRVVITCDNPQRLAAVINTLADGRFATTVR